MLKTFLATLSPMLVMLLCIVIGFALKKAKIVPDNTDKVLSKLENWVFVPALILSTFINYCTLSSLKQNYTIILYSLLALAIAIVTSIPLSIFFEKHDKYRQNIYRYAMAFANSGFMGNAIVPAILGSIDSEILYKYLLFTLPINTAIYTWGMIILIPHKDGEKRENPLKKLLNPTCIAIAVGISLGLLGVKEIMPDFLNTAISYCKDCMGPIAMILTGFVVGGYSAKAMLSNKKVYLATFLRLFILPAIILTVIKLAGASDTIMTLALFAYATPLGLNTIVFPAAYGGETETGAAMAMISHTLCVVSIPIMYSLLTKILA